MVVRRGSVGVSWSGSVFGYYWSWGGIRQSWAGVAVSWAGVAVSGSGIGAGGGIDAGSGIGYWCGSGVFGVGNGSSYFSYIWSWGGVSCWGGVSYRGGNLGYDWSYAGRFLVHYSVESVVGIGGVFYSPLGSIGVNQGVATLYNITTTGFLLGFLVSGVGVADAVSVVVVSGRRRFLDDGFGYWGCVSDRRSILSNWSSISEWSSSVSQSGLGNIPGVGNSNEGSEYYELESHV